MAFEDIVIVDLDVQKTTWSRVHLSLIHISEPTRH